MQKKKKNVSGPMAKFTQREAPVARMSEVQQSRQLSAGHRFRRSEFVGGVVSSATNGFKLAKMALNTPGYDFNPASSIMFPWLSQVAEHFEQFIIHSLEVRFVSSQPTSTAGRVYMAIDYDYDDAVSIEKSTFMGNASVAEGPIWGELCLKADSRSLHPRGERKYTSTVSRTNFIEPRTAFCGFLMIAFDPSPTAGNTVGDLWVSYDIELFIPSLDTTVVVDTFGSTGLVGVSTLPMTGVKDTAYYLTGNPSYPTPLGADVVKVKVGEGQVPALSLTGSGYLGDAPQYALDMQNAPNDGWLSLLARVSDSALKPSELIINKGPTVEGLAYDSLGTYLGKFSALATEAIRTFGAATATAMDTVGGQGLVSTSGAVKSLRALYPTLRYLVPLVSNAIANAAATQYVDWGGWKYAP